MRYEYIYLNIVIMFYAYFMLINVHCYNNTIQKNINKRKAITLIRNKYRITILREIKYINRFYYISSYYIINNIFDYNYD